MEQLELDAGFDVRADVISDERSFCNKRLSLQVDNWTLERKNNKKCLLVK